MEDEIRLVPDAKAGFTYAGGLLQACTSACRTCSARVLLRSHVQANKISAVGNSKWLRCIG